MTRAGRCRRSGLPAGTASRSFSDETTTSFFCGWRMRRTTSGCDEPRWPPSGTLISARPRCETYTNRGAVDNSALGGALLQDVYATGGAQADDVRQADLRAVDLPVP